MTTLIFISISLKELAADIIPLLKIIVKTLPRGPRWFNNSVTSGAAEMVPVINARRQINGSGCFLRERQSSPPVSRFICVCLTPEGQTQIYQCGYLKTAMMWRYALAKQTSRHASIFSHLSWVGSGWQQVKQGAPDVALHSNIFQLLLGDPEALQGQIADIIPPAGYESAPGS